MPKRKRSDDSDSDSDNCFPTLVELCCHQFAKGLWQRVIRQNPLLDDSSKFDQTFIERCRDLVMETLRENSTTSIVARCQSTLVAQVNRLMNEMVNEFPHLIMPSCLMRYVLEMPKWNEFSFSMWCCLKEKIPEQRVICMFESIATRIGEVGLETISEDEQAQYLHIWRDLSKPMKLSVFDSLAYCWNCSDGRYWDYWADAATKENVEQLRRDLRFLSILFAEFDLSERRQIWPQHWLSLVFGASPSSLESLMKLCCEPGEPIEQFKELWLSKDEIIDNYYCLLIRWQLFDELNAFLSSYSAHESKVLDLTARILRSHLSSPSNSVRGFTEVVKIVQSGQWLERTIRMPEFEYYLRKDDIAIQMNWCWFLRMGWFDEGLNYITFFVPDTSERVLCERRFLREAFLGNDLPMRSDIDEQSVFTSMLLSKLDEFDKLIGRIFDAVDEAADFKKQMIFSPFTMEELRKHLDGNYYDSREDIQGLKFVTMCLPNEQDSSVWKERFMRDALRCIRSSRHLAGLFRPKNNFMTWCLDSPEKRAEFKTKLSIDDLYLAMERFVASDSYDARRRGNIANNILRWWFGDVNEMAAFKVKKLKRCATRDPMFRFLLNNFRNLYARSQNDEERMTHAVASCTNHPQCS